VVKISKKIDNRNLHLVFSLVVLKLIMQQLAIKQAQENVSLLK